MEHRATTAAALVPLLALAALLLGACDAAAAQRARPISQGPARACVEGVPGPIVKLKARARGQTAISYTWYSPRGDRRRGDVCVDYFERTVVEAGAAQALHASSGPLTPSDRDQEYSESWQDLTPATSYRVTVRAVNAKYGPGPATTAPVRTKGNHDDSHPPGPVLDFDVSQAGTSLLISWQPPQAGGWASSYEVLVADPNGRRLFDDTVDTPKVVVTSGVRSGTRYEILVAAVNHAGRGPMSRVYYTTASMAAAAPAGADGAAAAPEGAAAPAALHWPAEVLEGAQRVSEE